jgi:hypothetical protein
MEAVYNYRGVTAMTRRRLPLTRLIVAAVFVAGAIGLSGPISAEKLPQRLSNQEFWKLATDFSEADGTFHSENLVSNEFRFQYVLPSLVRMAKPGRAYLGVGSEQNFTYMAALHPDIAFIIDIRRGNMDLHLMYKALFELSTDRADFVSRLFSKKRPAGLSATSTAAQIFAAYESVPASQLAYTANLQAITKQLVTTHGFTLSAGDKDGIQYVYNAMFESGPEIHYTLNTGGFGGGGGGGFPTYADLMAADDGAGHARSYLASEESFAFLKDLETRNMVVPVVGNFGGPKAIRAVGSYLKQKETIVSAFYVSNVEQYLRQDGIWGNFCNNVHTLPLDATSTFIRSMRGGFGGVGRLAGPGFTSEVHLVAGDVANCAVR